MERAVGSLFKTFFTLSAVWPRENNIPGEQSVDADGWVSDNLK
jgi:hypothetical protein